ncbi:tRNA (adenine(22)-N(1))-methyltransferase [Brevibacillus migulae]|uniref:tRNA (adenine(22)-N(1))-methyltransferase n=1 Tax=Brevibacillus migulae TaxID=1644114 RepID=UPI00106DDC62|nr:tRNA (adenine(22)-N(1))-methyltransferase TrmK [Brevibacillus migulae]
MSSIIISRRLRHIAQYCLPGARVADIGSDHALLASYLLQNDIASFVIAGELNEGPYQSALRQIESLRLQERASVRKGNGLAVLSPGEVDTICIAGMGGQLIASILEAGKENLAGVKQLILQPNVGEEIVRRWLMENHWQLAAETILEEDGILYEILVAQPGEPLAPYTGLDRPVEDLMKLGPFLWQKKDPLLIRKWGRELDKWRQISEQIQRSGRAENQGRLEEISREMKWIEEVIACLQTDSTLSNTSKN